MRALRLGLTVLAIAAGAGCAHKKPPPPAPAPAPPPPPRGDTLRFFPKAGDQPHARVKLTIVQEVSVAQGQKGGARHLDLSFEFADEEKVEAVAADGTAQMSARLVDAVGQVASHGPGDGGTQQMVDDFALALDELKIQFKRSARGEVVALMLSGIRSPLEEQTARAMLNAMYSSQRGPILPEPPTDVDGTWKVETALPPSTGFTGLVSYQYKYARKGGGVAVISCEGNINGKGGGGGTGRTMIGKSTGEYRLELESGRLIGSIVDGDAEVVQMIPGLETLQTAVKQHVRAEWTLQDAKP